MSGENNVDPMNVFGSERMVKIYDKYYDYFTDKPATRNELWLFWKTLSDEEQQAIEEMVKAEEARNLMVVVDNWRKPAFREARNGIGQIVDYFSTPDKPVDSKEFLAFWYSLSMEDQEQLRHMELKTA